MAGRFGLNYFQPYGWSHAVEINIAMHDFKAIFSAESPDYYIDCFSNRDPSRSQEPEIFR